MVPVFILKPSLKKKSSALRSKEIKFSVLSVITCTIMIRKVFVYLLVPEVFRGDFLHVREDKPRESGKKSCQLRHKNSTLRDSFSPLPGREAGGGGEH